MTQKTFSIYRIVVVMVLAATVSVSVNMGNWYWPLASMAASWILLHALRKRVKEVMIDERDHTMAGKASGLAMRVYLLLSVVSGMIIHVVSKDPAMFSIAATLLYSACFLMVLYAVFFKIYERKDKNA
ncbi:MAG: DUF2178 domain-containing protein [Candidatus Pacebacteria bacterium]|nr:DUF2178 domain-containing protein [Candidatus Paceibacterota bacterium]